MKDKLPEAANMRKISWSDELAKLAEMWAAQCSSSLENIRTVHGEDNDVINIFIFVLLDCIALFTLIQYAQNIVRFEFNTEEDVSDYQMEEVVNYWFKSIGDNFDDNKNLIENFSVNMKDANLGYFTQLAWAKTYKIGKIRESFFGVKLRELYL